jgi:hypothetical protein
MKKITIHNISHLLMLLSIIPNAITIGYNLRLLSDFITKTQSNLCLIFGTILILLGMGSIGFKGDGE